MDIAIGLTGKSDLAAVEAELARLISDIAAASAGNASGRIDVFKARIVTEWGRYLFKEQWSAMALAPGLEAAERCQVLGWGHTLLPKLDDESFQVSLPALLAIQRGAIIAADGCRDEPAVTAEVRQYVAAERSGLLGQGGNWRCLVEFDPDAPVAAALNTGGDRRETFMAMIKEQLANLEVGARSRGITGPNFGPRLTVLQFLYELHMNGWEHASSKPGVRTVRLQKHFHGSRGDLLRKAGSFAELADYISRQPATGDLNLVEASVSDFGPGIVDGFLAGRPASRFSTMDRKELLDILLHRKLSVKSGDPDAGLGISQALEAAAAMQGMVSLRTGEFWLTMNGADGQKALRHRPGQHPKVFGTHWQLLYPDPTSGGRRAGDASL